MGSTCMVGCNASAMPNAFRSLILINIEIKVPWEKHDKRNVCMSIISLHTFQDVGCLFQNGKVIGSLFLFSGHATRRSCWIHNLNDKNGNSILFCWFSKVTNLVDFERLIKYQMDFVEQKITLANCFDKSIQ